MKLYGWSGYWPPKDGEYPPDGTLLRYEKRGAVKEARLVRVWCGIEPAFTLDNGDTIFPTLDPCIVASPSAAVSGDERQEKE